MSFNTRQLNQTELLGERITTLQITNNRRKMITPTQIKNIMKGLRKNQPKDTRIRVRGLGKDHWHTLKSLDGELKIKDYKEYASGTSNPENFTNYFQLEILVIRKI